MKSRRTRGLVLLAALLVAGLAVAWAFDGRRPPAPAPLEAGAEVSARREPGASPQLPLVRAEHAKAPFGHYGPQSRPEAYSRGVRGRVLGPDLKPAPHARLWLVPAGAAAFARGVERARHEVSADATIVPAPVDAAGAFCIGVPDSEPEARFDLHVAGEGLATQRISGLEVPHGAWRDLGTLRTSPGHTIVGTVRARGSQDSRIAGALVTFRPLADQVPASFVPEERFLPVARTNTQGEYRIEGIRIGATGDLEALAPGHAREVRRAIHLERHAENRFDFELAVGTALEGRVVSVEGAPVAVATVVARPVRGAASGSEPKGAEGAPLLAHSDLTGAFVLPGLLRGSYELNVSHPDFASVPVPTEVPGAGPLVVTLARLATLRVRVVDARGAPVRRFELRLRHEAGGPDTLEGGDARLRELEADETGAVSLPGIAPDPRRLVVEVRAAGHAPTFSAPLEPALDAAPLAVDLRLEDGGAIVGRVLGSAGEPLAGVLVCTLPAVAGDDPFSQRSALRTPSTVTEARARTDAEGRFRLRHLHPTRYVLRLVHEGSCPHTLPGVVVREGETTMLQDLRLLRGTRVRGSVRFLGVRPPFAKATVTPLAEAGRGDPLPLYGEALLDRDGAFAIDRRLPPGRYRLAVGAVMRPDAFHPLGGGPIGFQELTVDGRAEFANVILEVPAR